jgi:hypothetical protein
MVARYRAGRSAARASTRKRAPRSLTHAAARDILLAFPGVEEGPCYGTPGFRVRDKFLARFHPDGESMVLKVDMDDREILMRSYPEVFYVTDHYRNYPSVLVRIARADPAMVRDLVEQSWRRCAPKRLVAAYDAER